MGIALALAVLVLGLMLAPIARWLEQLEATARFQEWIQRLPAGAAANMANYLAGAPPPPEPKGPKVLIWFAVFVAVLTLITLVAYWPSIQVTRDEMFFWAWLFVMMVFGMFVQVLALNRSSSQSSASNSSPTCRYSTENAV